MKNGLQYLGVYLAMRKFNIMLEGDSSNGRTQKIIVLVDLENSHYLTHISLLMKKS